MKFRGIILLLGSMFWSRQCSCPEFGSDDLPSAPSAVQQERSSPSRLRRLRRLRSAAASSFDTIRNRKPTPQPRIRPPRRCSSCKPAASCAKLANRSAIRRHLDDDAAATITKTVNEVNVVFTVTDKHGRYVKNLAKSDFSVIDDSKPAEPDSQLSQRDRSAAAGRTAGRCQQLGARPFQVRAGIGHRVSQPDDPAPI